MLKRIHVDSPGHARWLRLLPAAVLVWYGGILLRHWLSGKLVLGAWRPPRILGSAAIDEHNLMSRTPAAPEPPADREFDMTKLGEPAGDEPDPLKRNLLQWRRVISAAADPAARFAGQAIDVVGFVRHAPDDGPQQFTLARYVIRCCLADATPLGLPVRSPSGAVFEADLWVHVRGTLVPATVDDTQLLVIEPRTIEPIAQPAVPYINGTF